MDSGWGCSGGTEKWSHSGVFGISRRTGSEKESRTTPDLWSHQPRDREPAEEQVLHRKQGIPHWICWVLRCPSGDRVGHVAWRSGRRVWAGHTNLVTPRTQEMDGLPPRGGGRLGSEGLKVGSGAFSQVGAVGAPARAQAAQCQEPGPAGGAMDLPWLPEDGEKGPPLRKESAPWIPAGVAEIIKRRR